MKNILGILIIAFLSVSVYSQDSTATKIIIKDRVFNLGGSSAAAIEEVNIKTEDNASNLSTISGNVTDIGNRQDSIVAILGNPTTSSFTFDTKTANASAVLSDAQDNKIIFLDYADEDFTIPSGVFESGQSIRIQSAGSGSARILPAAGVSFAPFDGFQLDSITKAITLARINTDTSPEDWFPLDGYIKNYSTVDPNAGNLLTANFYGNLGSPDSSAAPPGYAPITGTIALETTTVFNGTTAMDYTNGSTSNGAYFTYPTTGLLTGDSITLTFKYYRTALGTANTVRLYDATGGFTSFSVTGSTGVWLDGSVTATLGGLTNNRIYLVGDGDYIVDNLKLVKN